MITGVRRFLAIPNVATVSVGHAQFAPRGSVAMHVTTRGPIVPISGSKIAANNVFFALRAVQGPGHCAKVVFDAIL